MMFGWSWVIWQTYQFAQQHDLDVLGKGFLVLNVLLAYGFDGSMLFCAFVDCLEDFKDALA